VLYESELTANWALTCVCVVGDMAGIVDGERTRSDQVHHAECRVQAERRERLDEVRDCSQAAQTYPANP